MIQTVPSLLHLCRQLSCNEIVNKNTNYYKHQQLQSFRNWPKTPSVPQIEAGGFSLVLQHIKVQNIFYTSRRNHPEIMEEINEDRRTTILKKLYKLCSERKIDIFQPLVNKIILFLTNIFQSKVGRRVTVWGPALLVARRDPEPKKNWKEDFFDFKQKKNTRRNCIYASQLAITNFNDISENHMNRPCVFYFYVAFLKNQNISSTFLQKANTSSFYLACQRHAFFMDGSLI